MNSNYKRYTDFWNPTDDSWLVDSFLNDDQPIVTKGKDHVALAGYRRAISNFVNIISGKSIPVTFKGRESYTDFNKVVLSGNINEKNFDFNCGLAMHEGSHLVYTDREALGKMSDIMKEELGPSRINGVPKDYNFELENLVKKITNYIEDRRIDTLVYKSAPGYRGYYQALYKKYFEAKSINKAFRLKIYDKPTVTNYLFYITGMTNVNCDSSDLPGLKEIFKTIDLNNVSRLKNTTDVMRIATRVAKIIIRQILKSNNLDGNKPDLNKAMNDFQDNENTDSTDMYPNAGLQTKDGKLDSTATNAFNKIKDLIDGNVKKTRLTSKDLSTIQGIESSGSEYKDIEVDGTTHKVLLVKKLTPEMLARGKNHYNGPVNILGYSERSSFSRERVEDAIRLGSVLGKKLQIRNEDRSLKFTRKDAGRIDKRLIAELGFGNDNVFSKTLVTSFKKASLHLTIDFSGSMNGIKLNNSITSAVAIAKAASMVSNINVVISARNTTWERRRGEAKPMICIIYDSKINKLSHIRKYFPYLTVAGLTPEGLCFEAVRKIISDGNSEDNYFVNYSDGQPYAPNYGGNNAVRHTKKIVDNIRHSGTKVLSYFIYESAIYRREKQDFKIMYGKDAQFIDPTNMMDVARTLNKAFLGN